MLEVHATFHGRVQGVFFRAKARTLAKELGLTGFVRNTSNGAVELLAQGEKKGLEFLITQLKNAFHINKIETEFVKPEKTYPDFSIVS